MVGGYTDLHYFDPKTRTWCATFVDPEHGSVARFTGGPVGNDRLKIAVAWRVMCLTPQLF